MSRTERTGGGGRERQRSLANSKQNAIRARTDRNHPHQSPLPRSPEGRGFGGVEEMRLSWPGCCLLLQKEGEANGMCWWK